MTNNTDFIELVQKLLNKQQKKPNSGIMDEPDFRNCNIMLFEISSFQ